MSKPTGTSEEILNLPSGGGSVSDPGAGFDVDLNTGGGSAGFDIIVPPGPNGIAPPLTLNYSTTSGQGPFGLGWSFGFATITRQITPSAATPDPLAVGTYALVGAGDLVDVGSGRYRPTVDTTGQLIQFENGSWTLTDCHDNNFTLGAGANSQIGDPPAVWLLDHFRDSSGNTISYEWIEEGGGRMPGTISWGTYQVIFLYEERPDAIVNGQFGAPIEITRRCSAIQLHVTTEQQSLVRSWALLYEDERGRGRSLLSAIREQGHDADGTTLAAPDRTFGYTVPQRPVLSPVTGWTAPIADPNTDLVDLDGDGLPDLLQLGGGLPAMRPNLGGSFGYPRTFRRAPAALRLSSADVAFADMSGEGNVDLLVLNQGLSGYYPLSVPQDGSAPSSFGFPVTFSRAPAVLPADPRVRLLDLNGDGITDVLFDTGRAWLEFLREDTSSWSETPRVLASAVTPPVQLTDDHVYLADMTGDGLTDIVRVDGGGVTCWPGRADGGWGAEIAMMPSPSFDRRYDPSRMNVVDIDGDGCADLVYVGPMSVTVWRNVGAGQLADPLVVDFTPYVEPGSYRIVDLLGSGTLGVLFELPQLRPGRTRQAFLDLCGGVKPYLLEEYANGPCQSTAITYRSSTSYALEDADAGSPWQTYHPFPVQCVARTDQTDHASGVVSSTVYSYHSGRYDPASRTFLGFATVACEQLGDETCPTLRTVTTFHVGLDPADPGKPLYGDEALRQGALRRRVLSTTVYGLDGGELEGRPYSVSSHTYDALLLPSGLADGSKVAVPYMTSTTEQRWEREEEPVSTRLVEILAVNEAGNVTLQRTRAQRAGVALADQDVTTATTFASGGVNLELPARVTQTGPDGTVICESVTYYDGDPYVGLPEGQATQGLVSRVEQLAFDDDFVASLWGESPPQLEQYGYHRLPGDASGWWLTLRACQRETNAGGPRLLTKGPLGGLQQLQYDSAGQRVVNVTDAAGNTVDAVVDARVWQTSSITDVNGHTATDVFDALGRVTATIGPRDTAAAPLFSYEYTAGQVCVVDAAARVAHGGSETMHSLTWIGGSGQVLGKSEPAATEGQWIVSNAASRNGRGLITAGYLPYLLSGQAWQPPPAGTPAVSTRYDALGRVVQLVRPDGLTISTRREGSTVTISEQWPGGPEQDVERQVFDAAGQLISVARNAGDGWVGQTYEYAPSGRISKVTLPSGLQVSLDSDLLGRRCGHQSPDSGRAVYLVDACGTVRLRENGAGQRLRSEVDSSNRVTEVFYDDESTPRIQYHYVDQADATPTDTAANRCGRVGRITDELGEVAFTYDEMGRVTTTVRTVGATTETFTSEQAYDAMGRVTTSVMPPTVVGGAGRTVAYAYGPDGRVESASGVVNHAAYDLYGRPMSLSYANGALTQISYKPNGGGVERVQISDASGAVLRDMSVTQAQAFVTGLVSATDADDSVSLAYDSMRRLTGAQYTNGTSELDTHAWSYDEELNMLSDSDAGPLAYRPGTHQLQSIGGRAVTYDDAGRMASGTHGSLSFDAGDHLASVTDTGGGVVSHTYDYGGRRVRSLTNGVQSYLSPLANLELQGQNAVAWIAFGGLTVAVEVNGVLWFLHANALGATDLATDSAGAYGFRLRQTPFGVTRADNVPPAASSGAALSALLGGASSFGLVCRGQRWYDPAVGQFISPDPVIPGVFVVGAWNPYAYCLGNPIALCDPTGCSFLSVLEVIGIALVAACCVILAMASAGAALSALGVVVYAADDASMATMTIVGIGTFGSALAGEVAAQKAGGNVWAGAFVGALLGGVSSYAGAALGAAYATSINAGLGYNSVASFVASGVVQGQIAGMGTGLAVGFAGGKGSLDSMMKSLFAGGAWGASLGALLGLGIGMIVGGPNPDNYINFFSFLEKFAKDPAVDASEASAQWTFYQNADSVLNATQSGAQMVVPGGGNLSAGNIFGFLSNFVSTGPTASGLAGFAIPTSIPLAGLANAVLTEGGLTMAIDASMASDQLGFTYSSQFLMLMGAAPVADLIFAQIQMSAPSALNWFQEHMDQLYDANEV